MCFDAAWTVKREQKRLKTQARSGLTRFQTAAPGGAPVGNEMDAREPEKSQPEHKERASAAQKGGRDERCIEHRFQPGRSGAGRKGDGAAQGQRAEQLRVPRKAAHPCLPELRAGV